MEQNVPILFRFSWFVFWAILELGHEPPGLFLIKLKDCCCLGGGDLQTRSSCHFAIRSDARRVKALSAFRDLMLFRILFPG